jgi:hypothetical protein
MFIIYSNQPDNFGKAIVGILNEKKITVKISTSVTIITTSQINKGIWHNNS